MISIFGVTLKKFARLLAQGEKARASKRTQRLFTKPSKKIFKTKNIQDLTFSEFVELERFCEEEDFINFCRIFVKVRCFEKIYVHNLPLIMEEFAKQKAELIEQNDFVFDPPIYGEPQQETIGSELRKEFVERFGNYVILIDVLCMGDFSKYKTFEQWTVREFFFWANYKKGQQILESVK